MYNLFLSDLLAKAGIGADEVLLIRHGSDSAEGKVFVRTGMIKEWTQCQKESFGDGFKYWMVFLSCGGTLSKFYGLYERVDKKPNTVENMPEGFPMPQWYDGKNIYHELKEVELFDKYRGRLIIDWGKGTVSWYQNGRNEKAITAILDTSATENKFPGYENVLLSYNDMQEMINNPISYADWHTALSAVNGVYLIVDTKNGDRYVGSAYGTEGILGRWKTYANDPSGGNKLLKEVLAKDSHEYLNFQYCILQILPHTCTNDEVIITESLWKNKLMTRQFGLNDN